MSRSNRLWPPKLAATEPFWLRWCVIFGQIFGLQSIQSAPYIAAVVATAICGKSCDMGAGAMSDDMSAVQLLRAVGRLWKKLDLCVVCEHSAYGCLKRRKTTVCVCWTNAWFWEAEWAMSGWIPSKDVGLHAVWDCNHFVVVIINAFLEICATICEPWQRQTWVLWRWGNSFYEAIIMEPWGGKRGGSSLSYKSLIRVYQISPTPGKTVFIPWSNLWPWMKQEILIQGLFRVGWKLIWAY